ncbi:MAG TPA: NAD(P)/FAD-dependent oxidoreductase, partial [Nitrososphaerales archaeon]|nr:NAD(P)/FAD-dependent oxidoreductase [Nitrososphaerales archaeon]
MVSKSLKLAVVGAGVAGAYMMNRLPAGVEAEAFEMRTEKNWYTVCAWGTSQPFIRDMVKQAGFSFDDYVLHKGKKMRVDLGDDELNINLTGLVTYDKHRLTEDMLKGKKVHWGAQVKEANGSLAGFDTVVDATGLHRSLLPKIKDDLLVPSLEYQVKSKDLPYDDFVIRPYPGLSGYWWFFPLGDGMAHVGAGDLQGRYRYELDDFVKKYHCEVLR